MAGVNISGPITYPRGTTFTIVHTYQINGAGATTGVKLFFTVKTVPYDSSTNDATAILSKTIPMTGATTNIVINPTDIADTVTPGRYFYDIKVLDNSASPDPIFLLAAGNFILEATPTNRTS